MSLSYLEAKFTIATSTTLSAEIQLEDRRIVAIIMPAAWTAAAISLKGANILPGKRAATEDLQDVFDSAGAEINITAVQGHYVVLTQAHREALASLRRVVLRSGLTAAAVAQLADRTLTIVTEPYH